MTNRPKPRSSEDARHQLVAVAVLVAVLVGTIGVMAMSVSPTPEAGQGEPAVEASEDLREVHAAGVTGENVSVGVVDVTGFDPDHDALDGRVVAARSFAPGETVRNGGNDDHGTAAASLVAGTAPDADLYLASFDAADGFERAVVWLLRQDVDVIVAPVSFYGKPGDGSSRVAHVASYAASRGVTFVAPAGNLGEGHWEGIFAPADDGRHRFAGGPRNRLAGDGRELSLWLSWERGEADRAFGLELYRREGTTARLVARSQPYPGDDVPNERIVARLDPDGTYFFVVRGPANASGTRLSVSSPTHTFEFVERAGSVVAPATAADAIAVGAYDDRAGRVEPFSSAGPVGDRPGVDVVAPDRLPAAGEPGGLVGSSAAAPYVAGVAALVLDADPTRSPAEVKAILTGTAVDAGSPGVDSVAGHGRVGPRRAVERAGNSTAGVD